MKMTAQHALVLLTLPVFGLLGSSCNDSGGDGGGVQGNSTVTGQVSSFSGTVAMDGTGLRSQVANGGIFVLSGAPEGTQTLTFTQTGVAGLAVGSSVKLQVTVPANSTVSLGTVKVEDNSVHPSHVRVTANPGAAASVKLRGDGSVDDSPSGSSSSDDTGAGGVKLRGDGTVDDNGTDATDDNGSGKGSTDDSGSGKDSTDDSGKGKGKG